MSAAPIRLSGDEIKRIVGRGKHKSSAYLSLYWLESKNNHFKRAIIVRKQIDKRAVVRNRLRRIISEQIRPLYKDLKNYNLVISVKNPAATIDSQLLRKETLKILSASGLFKNNP